MNNSLRKEFWKYKREAEKYITSKLNSRVIGKNLWQDENIINYGARLSPDAPILYITKEISKIVSSASHPKILVIGDGVGRLARHLAKTIKSSKIIEIDKSLLMVKKSNKLAKEDKLSNFRAKCMDATKLSFLSDSFDYAVSFGMSRYLDLKKATVITKEALRVSKRGILLADARNPKKYKGYYSYTFSELKDKLNGKNIFCKLITKHMKMYRMSIFYQLYNRYNKDSEFRNKINNIQSKDEDTVSILSQIAGSAIRDYCELKIIKRQ